MKAFTVSDLLELWVLYGTNSSHCLHTWSKAMLSNHEGTCIIRRGCTRQVGSKTSPLKNDPKKYLTQFEEDPQLTFDSARKAEEYLEKALKLQIA